jgi:hypothetical protein
MRDRLFPLVLLSLFIFQSVFSYFIFELGRTQFYYASIHKLNTNFPDEIQTLRFSKNSNIEWEHFNEEFRLDGKLYDVLTIRSEDSTTIIQCRPDTKEDEWVDIYYNSLFDTSKKDSHSNYERILKDLVTILPDLPSLQFSLIFSNQLSIEQNTAFNTIFIEINSPPPNYYLLTESNT